MKSPSIVILAGPNGAGKSTVAPFVLRDTLAVNHFVNADVIARGLSGFSPDEAALLAGRIMVERLGELAERRADFAFETTLASRTLAPFLKRQLDAGYRTQLAFVSVRSPGLSVQRVAERVHRGGHGVPEETIRRRFQRGLRNLFELYMPLATKWQVFDNSAPTGLVLLARGRGEAVQRVAKPIEWKWLQELARHA